MGGGLSERKASGKASIGIGFGKSRRINNRRICSHERRAAGVKQQLETPLSIKYYKSVAKAFEAEHKHCKPGLAVKAIEREWDVYFGDEFRV